MGVIYGLEGLELKHRNPALTIGNFDGVHVGHQKIIKSVLEHGKRLGAPTMAITFDPHPVTVLAPHLSPKLLTPPEEKARLLMEYGIDHVLFINFSKEFARQDPDEFIKNVLVDAIGARAVVVGQRYAFGRGKKGSTDMLRRRSYKYGFRFSVVRNARMYGKEISSSRLRNLLSIGRIEKAAKLLGRPYCIKGTVITGAGRGATILDTPTANISTPYEIVPKDGVYAVRVGFEDGSLLDGVANIGNNPTFKDADRSYEVHLLDFKADLRGQELRLFFVGRLRSEIRFPTAEALQAQIRQDIEDARAILAKNPVR